MAGIEQGADIASRICLFLTVLFVLLWRLTPRDSTYETVELERVSTRRVFLILALVSFGAWLAIRYYLR